LTTTCRNCSTTSTPTPWRGSCAAAYLGRLRGRVYDCDFNLALGIPIKDMERTKFWEIDFSDFAPEITCKDHCLRLHRHRGSKLPGALVKDGEGSTRSGTPGILRRCGQEHATSRPRLLHARFPAGACAVGAADIADEIRERYYAAVRHPLVLAGLNGARPRLWHRRDSYILSKLVGETGFVTAST